MNKAIIGKKLGMSQVFAQDGTVIPVTVVEAGPCPIVQIKTVDKDGYEAVQIAFGQIKKKNVVKPVAGHYKKANVEAKRYLKEFRLKNTSDFKVGDEIKCSTFKEGDIVDVTGTSKGHGFSGTIQRWNMHRGPMSHGSGYHRGVGAICASATPGRVFKNRKMPGQWGNEQITIQNLVVVKVDEARNLLLIKGGIPGAKGGVVYIKQAIKS